MNDIDIFNLQPSVISRDLKGKYLLLYGRPKVGKTSFAVQTPKALVCAFELGVNALGGTRYVPIPKWSDMKKILSQLRKPQAKEMYDTVVIDTVSIAFDLCEKYICQRENVDSIRDIAWGQGWNMVKQEFQETMREITMLGFGLVLICHSKEKQSQFKDEDGNAITSVEPDLTKNAYQVCNAICDVIGYINVEFDEKGNSKRYLYTRQTPTIFAGSRYKYLKGKIPFGYQELVDAIGDAIDEDAKQNGVTVVDHAESQQVVQKSYDDLMLEAKNCWMTYLRPEDTDEEAKASRLIRIKDIVRRIFGNENFKISTATPSQVDLLDLFVTEVHELM